MERRKSIQVKAGNVTIGGDAPVRVQSMLNVPVEDIGRNVESAKELEKAGCEILRVTVPSADDAKVVEALKNAVSIPIVADIHFDVRAALAAVDAGADKIRINPGNMSKENVKKIAAVCRVKNIPIRVGVNSGSVEKELLEKYGGPCPQALAESALNSVRILEDCDFSDIVISLKSSRVQEMIEGYRIVAAKCSYPLHLGVTEAGTERSALIKSSIGIGSLLADGIGDTIRVSITGDTVREVYAGIDILKALNMRENEVQFISCPTCGRTKIDIISIANEVENRLRNVHKPITVAVMGCVVNGPGEAKNADIGIAGGDGCGMIFKNGEILRKVAEKDLVDELMKEIERM